MNVLFKSIEYTIGQAVKQYSDAISKKYKIDSKDLEKMWDDISVNIEYINQSGEDKPEKKKAEKKKPKVDESDTKSVNSSTSKNSDGCVYLFTRGKNSGSKCGVKTKTESYCSKHEKFEDTKPKVKKTLPKAKSISSNLKSAPTSPALPKKIDKVLRENKDIKKFWHPDTQLVFKSRDERVVIGRLKDGKICELNDEDIKLCESYSFKREEKVKESDIEDVLNKIMGNDDDDEEEYLEEEECDDEE